MAFDRAAVGKTFGPLYFEYDWQRVALYALACGATERELDLQLSYRGPKVLPTFSVVPSYFPLHDSLMALGGNLLTLVHGSQKCVIHRPIPAAAKLATTARIADLFDKGKGALAVVETETQLSGEVLFQTEWQIFYRGEGGFGGPRGPEAPTFAPAPGQAPDHVVEMSTQKTQAMLYRLASGDDNPIHSDPSVAEMAGFPHPILHGLCTFGHAGLAAVRTLAGGDPERLTSIEGRFKKPVFPGETISTAIFRAQGGEAYFTTSVKERDESVITLGRVVVR